MIDAQYFDKRDIESKYLKALESKLFARYCAREYALENYIALFCTMAYRKKPDLERLITFDEVFLKTNGLMEINTNGGNANNVKNSLNIGSEDSEIVNARIKGVLDAIITDVMINLNDTFTRYDLQVNAASSKYDFLYSKKDDQNRVKKRFAYRVSSKYKEYVKVLSDMKSSDFKIKSGLNILALGGYPTTKMGLSGIVAGL